MTDDLDPPADRAEEAARRASLADMFGRSADTDAAVLRTPPPQTTPDDPEAAHNALLADLFGGPIDLSNNQE